MDRTMTPQAQTPTTVLCPHLAAAALWMTKNPRAVRSGKVRQAAWHRAVTDDLAAL